MESLDRRASRQTGSVGGLYQLTDGLLFSLKWLFVTDAALRCLPGFTSGSARSRRICHIAHGEQETPAAPHRILPPLALSYSSL